MQGSTHRPPLSKKKQRKRSSSGRPKTYHRKHILTTILHGLENGLTQKVRWEAS
jgi:hypothetical protein